MFHLLLWSFIGIMLGNLYQALLTDSLIAPKNYKTNFTLEEMVEQNFTILLVIEIPFNVTAYQQFLADKMIDYRTYKYLESVSTNFYRQLIKNVVVGGAEKYNYLVENFCQLKLSSCPEWERTFGKKSYIAKLPMIMQNAQNYYHLTAQLSKCKENVVFIHNRNEMHNILKKIIPRMSIHFQREYKYLSLTHDFFLSHIVFACKSNNIYS